MIATLPSSRAICSSVSRRHCCRRPWPRVCAAWLTRYARLKKAPEALRPPGIGERRRPGSWTSRRRRRRGVRSRLVATARRHRSQAVWIPSDYGAGRSWHQGQTSQPVRMPERPVRLV